MEMPDNIVPMRGQQVRDGWGAVEPAEPAEEVFGDAPDDEAACRRHEQDLAELVGEEAIDVLREQAERLVPGRCPSLEAVFASVVFVDQEPEDRGGCVLVQPLDGPALLLGVPTWVMEAEALFAAARSARGPVVVIVAPPSEAPVPTSCDAVLVALVVTPVTDEGLLIEVATCGEPWAIFTDVWPSSMHLLRLSA